MELEIQPLGIANAQKLVDTWIKTVGIRYYSELTNLAVLMEEIGEVARLFSRLYGDQSFKEGESAEKLAEELSDVLFVLLCLANQTGVDLEKAFLEKMKIRTQRDAQRHKSNSKLY
ncbi:MAG: nucleotide pyrophosphohydrolase [Bacteroidia bacterium]|nr:nucleotide pyrophosphohydrolase [Bacteroidia bacterium]MDW8158743.1 nucleotide pyrophosphohydrolase [Bacteroidia bacterium]